MSRASWYRHGRPSSKPQRRTQVEIARGQGCSVRTLQRLLRINREIGPPMIEAIKASDISVGKAEWLLRPRLDGPDRVSRDRWYRRRLQRAGHVLD